MLCCQHVTREPATVRCAHTAPSGGLQGSHLKAGVAANQLVRISWQAHASFLPCRDRCSRLRAGHASHDSADTGAQLKSACRSRCDRSQRWAQACRCWCPNLTLLLPLRQVAGVPLSVPDLMLVGHAADAEYALGVATPAPLVASGGRDKNVRARPVPAACLLACPMDRRCTGRPVALSCGAASTTGAL